MVLLGGVEEETSKLLIVDPLLQLLVLALMMIYREKEQAENKKYLRRKNTRKYNRAKSYVRGGKQFNKQNKLNGDFRVKSDPSKISILRTEIRKY